MIKAPIFLCGFMGVGKSTIGRLLADKLELPLYDTDQMIVQSMGQSIAQIFTLQGEDKFRDLESAAIQKLAHLNPGVVALGGGALMNPATHGFIKKTGSLIYLSAELSTLQSRLVNSQEKRPLIDSLTAEQRIEKISHLLKQRENIYKTADMIVHTDGKDAETVMNNILQELKRG